MTLVTPLVARLRKSRPTPQGASVIHPRRRSRRYLALVVALALVAAACGGKKDGGGGDASGGDTGEPQRGGSVTYGIEAETGDGWCLQEGQLAISGIVVARSIYDTLTAPNTEGDYVPYLAEDVQPNDDFTQWTITVRDGITFHDGSELTATVVKNNLDAYRGAEGECSRNLVGTGPFMLESPSDWVEGREFKATKNPEYWQEAPDGEPYPYLDELTFQPVIEAEQRRNSIESGDLDMAHFSGAPDLIALRSLQEQGDVRTYESNDEAEVTFVQMNTSRPPLDDARIRKAAALAVDPEEYTEVINDGLFEMATGPFAPGSMGYADDTGFPVTQDLDEARRLIAEYEAENGPLRTITYQATPGAQTLETATFIQQTLGEIGVEIDIQQVQQDALIDNAISGDFDIMGFRNYPGGDPDELYVWFKGQSPVNFSRFDDPEINELLDQGRSEPDPAVREQIYQDLNRRMGEQVYSVWANYTTWMIASGTNVFGYDPETMPKMPNGDSWNEGLASGTPTYGIWVTEE
jgi:peptide/nickel transport system substrate-binding protein